MSFFDRILRSLENFFGTGGDVEDVGEGEDVVGWYLSGLQYSRNVGVTIFGIDDMDEAESILRDYGRNNIANYNDDFYGIGEIAHSGEPLDEVFEVNL